MAGSQEQRKVVFDPENWICGVQYGIVCEDAPLADTPAVEPAPAAEPEPEPAADPAAVAPAEPEPASAEPATNPLEAEDWRDKRIAKLTAQLRAAQAKPEGEPKADPAGGAPTEAEIEARIAAEADARANSIAAQREFDKACNGVAAEGRKAFPDFDGKLGALVRVVDRTDPASIAAYNTFLATAIETGKAHELIYALGNDLNEANRLLSLPPVKMALELARMAQGEGEQLPSGAPKPIKPIGARGTTHEAIDPSDPERADRLTTKQWMERREAQVEKSQRRA